MPEAHRSTPKTKDSQAEDGEVSEVSSLDPDAAEEITPSDATAGSPGDGADGPQEGTAGPDAPPRHGRPESSNESSR